MNIAGREIGPGHPVYIVAEIGANHAQSLDVAAAILCGAWGAGADAVKIQTYRASDFCTPDEKMYALYERAAMPLEIQAKLAVIARDEGITLFSTPGREWAVDWLEENLDPPAYKISSTSCTNLSLIRKCRETGKPLIISTGACSDGEIETASYCLFGNDSGLALLKCTAAYPATPHDMNLSVLRDSFHWFKGVNGFSDHLHRKLGSTAAVAAVALGATIIEKHVMLNEETAIDPEVSLTLEEFGDYVRAIRAAEQMLGSEFGPLECEEPVLWLKERLRSE